MRNQIQIVNIGILFFLGILSASAQPLGKSPEFLEGVKPNFFKMQKKAAKHFKKHLDGSRMEKPDTVLDTELGFGSEYDREEDNEYVRYKRWEWFWRDRVNP